jgi:hypothetical protein
MTTPSDPAPPRDAARRRRLAWWHALVVLPACVLAARMHATWDTLRPEASGLDEAVAIQRMALYVIAWALAVVALPLCVALLRRWRDGALAIFDDTLTIVLIAFLLSGTLAIVATL